MALNPVKLSHKYIIRRGERLHEPFNNLLIILSALGHAASLLAGGRTHRTERPVMRLGAHQCPTLALPMRGPFEHALAETLPDAIELGTISDQEAAKPMVGAVAQTGGFQSVGLAIGQPIFLMFFERYNVWLKSHLGGAANWPLTLDFARVVRNAIAHGKIEIRPPAARPVAWRGLTYDFSHNGREIIGQDLALGDLITLMLEADAELNALGAPIL